MHEGKKVGQTKVITDDQNPVFNYTCTFESSTKGVISFLVWDKHTATPDSSLGLHDMDCKNFEDFIPLKPGKGKPHYLSGKDAQLKIKISLGEKGGNCCAGCSVM